MKENILIQKFNNAIQILNEQATDNDFSIQASPALIEKGILLCTEYFDINLDIHIFATNNSSIIFRYMDKNLKLDINGNLYLSYLRNDILTSIVLDTKEDTLSIQKFINKFITD